MPLTEEDKQKTETTDLLIAKKRIAELEHHIRLRTAIRRTFVNPDQRAKKAEQREAAMLERAEFAEDREAAMLQRVEAAEYRAELAEKEAAHFKQYSDRIQRSHTVMCDQFQEMRSQNHDLQQEIKRLRKQIAATTLPKSDASRPALDITTVLKTSGLLDSSQAFFATANEPPRPTINQDIHDFAAHGRAYTNYLIHLRKHRGHGS